MKPSFLLHLWHSGGCLHSNDGSVHVSLRYFWNDFWNFFPEGLLTLGVLPFEVLFPPSFAVIVMEDRVSEWSQAHFFGLCHACSCLLLRESSLEHWPLWHSPDSKFSCWRSALLRLLCSFALEVFLSQFDRFWPQSFDSVLGLCNLWYLGKRPSA